MNSKRILIVEDEVLIADHISRYLERKGYVIAGMAISFEEAQRLFQSQKPDLALIDIRLNGQKTGIDFAHYLREQDPNVPYIFLTSQSDQKNIEAAKQTYPAGYLAKPVNKESLYATLEMALHRSASSSSRTERTSPIKLFDGAQYYKISYTDILYLEAEHVYVKVYLKDGQCIVQRSSLTELADQLPTDQFVRTHRSYLVNISAISRWESDQVFVGPIAIMISRGRRKEVLDRLRG